jgi:hypothetical protein
MRPVARSTVSVIIRRSFSSDHVSSDSKCISLFNPNVFIFIFVNVSIDKKSI